MTLTRLRRLALEPTCASWISRGSTAVLGRVIHRTRASAIGVWEYAPGEFESSAAVEQSACILSGSAVVELSDGRTLHLTEGDTFYLPRGVQGRWIVHTPLRAVSVENNRSS